MTTDERLDRITGIIESLTSAVVARDKRIEALVHIAEKQSVKIANLEKQWEAYLNTRPKN